MTNLNSKPNPISSTLTFWGGVGAVTGSNFKLEIPGVGKNGAGVVNLLVDCGMFQGGELAHEKNREPFPYDPAKIDVLLVTHAHIDHIGRIPKLVKDGFAGKIFSTRQTKEIAVIMFEDTLKIMAEDARRCGGHNSSNGGQDSIQNSRQILYGQEDVLKSLSIWETKPYHESFEVFSRANNISGGGDNDQVVCQFLDAGHILGSAMIKIERSGKSIIFTGDLGNSPSPIVRDAESPVGCDYLVLDGTYGDRTHQSREMAEQKFADIVSGVVKNRRTLLIPVFSLERAHIILYELNNLIENSAIESMPVYLDSPLASRLTPIYESSRELFNDKTKEHYERGDDVFSFPKLKIVADNFESKAIEKIVGPKIIIAGSGMSVGGRIPSHEIDLLPDPNTTLLITGYQSFGTLGRAIADGQKTVIINGQQVLVRAKIESIEGFSAHKDSKGLLEFVDTAKDSLKRIFVVHGEPKSTLFLVQRIRDYLGLNAIAPDRGKTYEIGL